MLDVHILTFCRTAGAKWIVDIGPERETHREDKIPKLELRMGWTVTERQTSIRLKRSRMKTLAENGRKQ